MPGFSGRRARGRADRGGALVESAIVLPIVVMLLFGFIEFGLVLDQKHDVSQAAAEAARLSAVNYSDTGVTGSEQSDEIVDEVCDRVPMAAGSTVAISLPDGVAIGQRVEVTITSDLDPVTGAYDQWLTGRSVSTTVTSRLEQTATFSTIGATACP